MKRYLLIIGILSQLNNGCIFSGDDIQETKIVGDYYISSFAGENSLLYRQPNAATDKVIYSNVDSIGWNEKFLFGIQSNEYFLYSVESQSLINRYKVRHDFLEECKKYNIENIVLRSTNKL